MKQYTEKQLIEMAAKELNIPVEQIYAEIDEVIKQCQKDEAKLKKIQYQEFIKAFKKNGWKLDRKYWTDEYRQKCSERMKLYWQQKNEENNYDKNR